MASQDRNVKITFLGIDKLSGKAKKIGKTMGNVAKAAAKTTLAIVAIGAAGAVAFDKLAKEAGTIQKLSKDFDTLAKSIGSDTAESMLALRLATRGLVKDTKLMEIGNSLMLQGIVKNSEEMNKLVGIADRLGNQTVSTEDRIESFSALLRNQSILRLDEFGISAGKVRERIEELQKETPGLARDVAFTTATIEEAEKNMALLGGTVETGADGLGRLKVRFQNLWSGVLIKITPTLDKIARAVELVIGMFLDAVKEGRNFEGLEEALAGIGIKGDKVTFAIGLLRDGVKFAREGFDKLKLAIGFVSEKFAEIKKRGDEFIKSPFMVSALALFKTIGEGIESFLGGAFEGLQETWAILVEVWNSTLKPAFAELSEVFRQFFDKANTEGEGFKKLMKGIGKFVGFVVKVLVLAFTGLILIITKVITAAAKFALKMKQKFDDVKVRIADFKANWADAWKKISEGVKEGKDRIVGFINEIIKKINKIPGIDIPLLGGEAQKKAIGGKTAGTTLVGERGPELVNLPRGSRVINAKESELGGGAGGGTTFNNTFVNTIVDPVVLAATLAFQLNTAGRTR